MTDSKTSRTLRILFLSHDRHSVGGATRSLVNMIQALGHRVEAHVICRGSGKTTDYIASRGIPYSVVHFKNHTFKGEYGVHYYLMYPFRQLLHSWYNYRAIKDICRQFADKPIDIVHTNSGVTSFGLSLARALGAKHVWHLREFQNLDYRLNPLQGWVTLYRQVRQSDATISISRSIQAHYHLPSSLPHFCFYNAVCSEKDIHYEQDRESFLLFCGGASSNKGIEHALQLFVRVAHDFPNQRLVILGHAPQDKTNKLLYEVPSDIHNRIVWKDVVSNVMDYMRKASALLMCSKHEAMGRVTVEAMAVGCPVLGYNRAGTSELLGSNKRGYVYNHLDEGESQLRLLLTQADATASKAKLAIEFVREHCTKEQYINRVWQVYSYLVE